MELPYGEIARLLEQGKIVPFLGPGVNSGKRPPGANYEETSRFLPSPSELSVELAMSCSFPATDDPSNLARVASYFVEASARDTLVDKLHAIFAREYEPCDVHHYLAAATAKKPLLIVTTNYDVLMEKALTSAGRRFDVVVHPADRKDLGASVLVRKHGSNDFVGVAPGRLHVDLETTTVVYKMHGSVQAGKGLDNYVVTEEDHLEFLARMTAQTAVPALFTRWFGMNPFLFMGCNLRDWNQRILLRNLRPLRSSAARAPDASPRPPESWAIVDNPSVLEHELWNARRVKTSDLDLNECLKAFRAALSSSS